MPTSRARNVRGLAVSSGQQGHTVEGRHHQRPVRKYGERIAPDAALPPDGSYVPRPGRVDCLCLHRQLLAASPHIIHGGFLPRRSAKGCYNLRPLLYRVDKMTPVVVVVGIRGTVLGASQLSRARGTGTAANKHRQCAHPRKQSRRGSTARRAISSGRFQSRPFVTCPFVACIARPGPPDIRRWTVWYFQCSMTPESAVGISHCGSPGIPLPGHTEGSCPSGPGFRALT